MLEIFFQGKNNLLIDIPMNFPINYVTIIIIK